jgi:hypothetical protein
MLKLALPAALFVFTVPTLGADEEKGHADLARLIESIVLPQVPRMHEDHSGWGKTAPVTNEVRLPRVRRTVVKVGDRMEWPHGAWKRNKVWIDDPARDIQIRVTNLQRVDKDRTRVGLEVTGAIHGEREHQQWVKGLRLLGLTVQADAVLTAHLDAEVTVAVDAKKFPPDISVSPKVIETKLELKKFDLNRVGVVQFGQKEASELGEELRGFIQDLLKQNEQEVTTKLNEAIAKGLKDGKAKLSPATLLKLNPPKEERRPLPPRDAATPRGEITTLPRTS